MERDCKQAPLEPDKMAFEIKAILRAAHISIVISHLPVPPKNFKVLLPSKNSIVNALGSEHYL